MAESELLLHIDAGVARITLNRPQKRNALTRSLLQELRNGIQDAMSRGNVRLMILSSAGPVFCAGMDLAEMQETAGNTDAKKLWQADAQAYRDLLALIFGLRIPTLAVVQGPALAGGLGLVLACDIVIASEAATFSLPEPKRGITAAVVTPLLVHRVGSSNASYLLLSGRRVDAHRALQMGICHEVVPAERLTASANELVDSILTGSPLALAVTKEQLAACSSAKVVEQLDRASLASAQARETEEADEGRRAFLEKRNPVWQPPGPGNWLD